MLYWTTLDQLVSWQWSFTEKKCHHFDEIFIIDSTGSCQNDNFRCSQRWKFHQNDNIFTSEFSSLSALEVVKMTTSSSVSDENFIKMTTFLLQNFHQWYTGSCQNDNFQCSQWRKFHQNDIFITVSQPGSLPPCMVMACSTVPWTQSPLLHDTRRMAEYNE